MRYVFSLLFCLLVMGCGKGSEKSEVKVKGLASALRPPARQGLKSVKLLNVPELASLEVTAEALGRAHAESRCVELPEIPVSLAGTQGPALAFESFDSKSTISFGLHENAAMPLLELPAPEVKDLASGKSGLSELALDRKFKNATIIQLFTKTGQNTQVEGCLQLKTQAVMADPVFFVDLTPRRLDVKGVPYRTFDAATIHIRNPNNAPLDVVFTASLDDSLRAEPIQLCHRLDPEPTGVCSPSALYNVSVPAKASMAVGIKGGWLPENSGPGWFRTVSLRVNWSFAATIPGVGTFTSPPQAFTLQ